MTTDGPYSLTDYILTTSSSHSHAHANRGVYTHSLTHSHSLVDIALPYTHASRFMPETQMVCHSTADRQQE